MELQDAEYTIKFTRDELYNIAYAIKNDLKKSIDNHYKNYNKELFYKQENDMLKIMEKMFYVAGYSWVYDSFIKEINEMFDKIGEIK